MGGSEKVHTALRSVRPSHCALSSGWELYHAGGCRYFFEPRMSRLPRGLLVYAKHGVVTSLSAASLFTFCCEGNLVSWRPNVNSCCCFQYSDSVCRGPDLTTWCPCAGVTSISTFRLLTGPAFPESMQWC